MAASRGAKNKFAEAIRKNNERDFRIEIIEDNIQPGEPLAQRERYWVYELSALGEKELNSIKPGGLGGHRGVPVVVEGQEYQSIATASQIIAKERGIEPYVVERCIREGKPIPQHPKAPQ